MGWSSALFAHFMHGDEKGKDLEPVVTHWNHSVPCGGHWERLDPVCDFCHYGAHDMYVIGFVGMFVVAFGWIANCFNGRIFTHRFMIGSTLNWYYACLSVTDFIILTCGLFRDIMPRLTEYNAMGARIFERWTPDHTAYGPLPDYTAYGAYSFCSMLAPFTQGLGCVAQTSSVYLTVAMSAHRFVGVCFPFKAHRICTKRNTRILIGSVFAFAFLFNLSRFFEVTTTTVECDGTNITETGAREFRMDPAYVTYYIGWGYFVVMYFIPFTLLITLNVKVVLAIRHTVTMQRRMSVAEPKSKEQQKERATSIMLVGVVIVFLVCNTPGFIANLMEMLDLVGNIDVFSKVVDYTNLLAMVNASINCFVYLSFSDKYRALLKHYLTCGCFHNSEPLIDQTQSAH